MSSWIWSGGGVWNDDVKSSFLFCGAELNGIDIWECHIWHRQLFKNIVYVGSYEHFTVQFFLFHVYCNLTKSVANRSDGRLNFLAFLVMARQPMSPVEPTLMPTGTSTLIPSALQMATLRCVADTFSSVGLFFNQVGELIWRCTSLTSPTVTSCP